MEKIILSNHALPLSSQERKYHKAEFNVQPYG
jgi:hypothetical protein